METIRIDILNPKALKLLNNLADLNLIRIKSNEDDLSELIKKIRSNSEEEITLENITKEVEAVRQTRNAN
ncbi:MAG: hypothetical protein R2863_07025 [Candidatus Kapaibacterium sp.]|nr:hypothetical protein [Ignavibacteriota bacterium]MCB9221592.1 hypothetical protein [Ignavibacteria bacterium]